VWKLKKKLKLAVPKPHHRIPTGKPWRGIVHKLSGVICVVVPSVSVGDSKVFEDHISSISGLNSNLEDEGDILLGNVCDLLQGYTALHARKWKQWLHTVASWSQWQVEVWVKRTEWSIAENFETRKVMEVEWCWIRFQNMWAPYPGIFDK
jgi:hypothetical protein